MSNKTAKREDRMVSIGEAAEILGVSIATVRRWSNGGTLKATRKGRYRYFKVSELERVKFEKPLGISEAAKLANVSVDTMRRLDKRGVVVPERSEDGERLYTKKAMEDFLASEYFVSKKAVEQKVLKPAKRETGEQKAEEKVLDVIVTDHDKKIKKLSGLRKAFLRVGVSTGLGFVIVTTFLTVLFLIYPEKTSQALGYYQLPSSILHPEKGSGAVLGTQDEDTVAVEAEHIEIDVNIAGTLLKPFSVFALSVVKVISQDSYERAVPSGTIDDTNTNNLFVLGDAEIVGNIHLGGLIRHNSPVLIEEAINFIGRDGGEIAHIVLGGSPTSPVHGQESGALDETLVIGAIRHNQFSMEAAFWSHYENRPLLILSDASGQRSSIFDGSVQIGKDGGTAVVDGNYNVFEGFNLIDGDTGATGADLGVEDDIEAKGSIYSQEDVLAEGNVLVGGADETLSNASFLLNGSDLLVLGDAGIEGNIYSDSGLIVGSGTGYKADKIELSATGTLGFSDGTNTLFTVKDRGDYGSINIDPKGDTGDPSSCTVGDIYVNDTDDTIKACTDTDTWEVLDNLLTDGGTTTYITSLTDDIAFGGSDSSAPFYFDESAEILYLDGATPLIFEGDTEDAFETTFAITDATADRTITFQDGTGTVAFTSDTATDITCTDCLNATEIEDIYLFNTTDAFTSGTLTFDDSTILALGSSDDFTISHNGTNTVFDNTFATGATQFQLGTDTNATAFQVLNDTGTNLFEVDGSGNVGIGTNAPSTTLDVVGYITALGLQDDDGDTKIQVEESADEDIIRFDLGGTERWVMQGSRLEPMNTGNSVFIGEGAGAVDDLTDNFNTAVGYNALTANTTGSHNAVLGYQALMTNSNGTSNVAIGAGALKVSTVTGNTAIGYNALLQNTIGIKNTAIGLQTLFSNTSGITNTAIGYQAGLSNITGSGSVFLGHLAGYNETGSNKLYIDNSNTATPLIYGDFGTDALTINGSLTTTGTITFSGLTTDGVVTTTSGVLGSTALSALDAGTLDSLDSLQFLRSDTSDAFTSGTLTFNDSTILALGSSNDFTISHGGTNTVFDNTFATGATQFQLGTDTNATAFQVLNDTGATLFEVDGSGTVTATGTITGGTLTDGSISITGGNLTGATGVTATNLTGTLQTAAQANITSLGTLTGLTSSGTITLSGLSTDGVVTVASGVLGSTANASLDSGTLDSLDSLQFLRSDTSDVYTSGTLTFNDSTILALGTSDDFTISHGGTNTVFDNTFATGATQFQLGTDTTATAFQVLNNTGTNLFEVDGSGNVGIGTATPQGLLDIEGAVTGKALTILNETGDQDIFTASASGTTRFVIDNSGNVGIGTASPTTELEVVGDITSKGTKWTARTTPADKDWDEVVYGNGLFVAVGSAGTGNRVMTSSDGINWATTTSATDKNWRGIIYGNGLFVAVASGGTAGNRVMTSPDGINWTSRTTPIDNNWTDVTYGNGLFVATATTGDNRVMTSPDGITWTEGTSIPSRAWVGVTYGNGLFVAVSLSGAFVDQVMTSSDGLNWTLRSEPTGGSWRAVTYGNGLFVAVGDLGNGTRVMTSPDGITWTPRTSAADNGWNSVTYGNGLFVAVSWDGLGNRVMTSPDGITWTSRTSTSDSTWLSVTYGNGLFVAVHQSAAGNQVMTSGKTEINALAHNNILQGGLTVQGGLDVLDASLSTTAATTEGLDFTITDIGIVTTGTDTLTGLDFNITRTGATGGTINTIGLDLDVVGDTGGTSTLTGLDVNVSGADTNYAAIFAGGNVGIGDTSPAALFTVGNGDLFQVDSSGNVTLNADSTALTWGAGSDFNITHNGTNTVLTSATGNLLFDNTNTTGATIIQLGTDTSAADFQVLNDTGTTLFEVDGAGDVTLAGGNFTQTAGDPVKAGGTTVAGSSILAIYVSGNYAYLGHPGQGSREFDIFDISDPTNPIDISTGLELSGGVSSVYVAGQYAYVTRMVNRLVAIDISDPTSPSQVDDAVTADVPNAVYVSGNYAYVGSAATGDDLEIFDISDPTNLTKVGGVAAADGVNAVYVQGNYAYVGSSALGNDLEIFDISDPTNPTLVGGAAASDAVNAIYVSGRYAYVGSSALGNDLEIFDISDPTNPTLVGGAAAADGVNAVYVSGKYAYVGSEATGDDLEVFDISNPASPTKVGGIAAANAVNAVYVSGQYAYVGSDGTGDDLEVFDLGGIDAPSASIGALAAGTLDVMDNLDVANDAAIGNGLVVGSGGIFSQGGLSVDYFSTSTTAGTELGSKLEFTDTGIVTTGTDISTGFDLDFTRTGATGGIITSIGLDIDATADNAGAGTSTLTGLTVDVSGADTNYAALFSGGNVGIGTTAPQSLLDVQGPTGTGSASAGILTLATKELTIVDGDILGKINFNAPLDIDGSDAILAGAAIWAEADATFTASVNNTELVFATATTSVAIERMRIDASGNVGIGTDTPSTGLQVGKIGSEKDLSIYGDIFIGKVSSDDQFNISNIGNGNTALRYLQIVDNDTIGAFSGISLTRTGVGIGTTSPQSLLDVRAAAGSKGLVTIASDELTVVDGDILGQIDFNAPVESDGSVSILVGASIWAEADDIFSTTVNSTELVFATGTSAAATEKVRIDSAGNVGIGTSTPAETLTVAGALSGFAGSFFNDGGADTNDGVFIQACLDANPTSACNFLELRDGDGGVVGAIEGDGAAGVTLTSGAADYAELFSGAYSDFEKGDMIALANNGQVVKAYQGSRLLGVYSTSPITLGNWKDGWKEMGTLVPVGLLGQIDTKISTENGNVAIGDLLTASSQAGVARKADPGDQTIGYALQAYSGDGVGSIKVFINLGKGTPIRLVDFSEATSDGLVLGESDGLSVEYSDFMALENRVATLEIATALAEPVLEITEETSQGPLFEEITELADLGVLAKVNYKVWSSIEGFVFNAKVRFEDTVEFATNAIFRGTITVNSDTVGTITIPAGETKIQITFNTPFEKVPVVTLTPVQGTYATYTLEDVREDGFVVSIVMPQESDTVFTWSALLVEGEPVKVEVIKDVFEELGLEDVEVATESGEIDQENAKQVLILDSELGFVRVRAEATVASEHIGEVLPGEIYNYSEISEETGWYYVEYEENGFGWVSGGYVEEWTNQI